MTDHAFRIVTRTQGNNRALKDGTIRVPGAPLEFEEVPVLVKGFRRMVRELAYDICEMALTTYITARAHGVAFTALPIFLVRDFHHGAMSWNTGLGLTRPKDLEGRRVAVNRGYTVTTGVWARSILQDEHGVDLSRVSWAPTGDEHVASFVNPPNVRNLPEGTEVGEEIAAGRLAGIVGATVEAPGVAPIIPDAFAAGVAALKTRGLYPINHLVVVRDDVLAANPGLGAALFEAFAASKRLYVDDLRAGRVGAPTAADRVHLAALDIMADPLPYGIAPNLKTLETLMGHAVMQRIIPAPVPVEDLFAAETRELVG